MTEATRQKAESIVDSFDKSKEANNRARAESIADNFERRNYALEQMGSDFDPETFAPKTLRWSLARGDNFEEKQKRLRRKYPDGELRLEESSVVGFEQETLLYRESPQSQWKRVEPEGFDAFDIPEAIAPSAEAIALEGAMAIGSGGSSIPATVARQALGATAGEAIEQGMQSASGLQAQTGSEIAGQVAFEGGMSAVGGFVASPIVGLYNISRGSGALKVGDEGIDVMRAAQELNPELNAKLLPGLVSDNPSIQTSEAQAAALLPGITRRYNELIKMLDDAVRSSAKGNASQAMEGITSGMDDLSANFLKRLKNYTKTNPVSKTEGGRAVIFGIEEYSKRTKEVVDAAYDLARKIDEPEFNMKPMFNLASDLKVGSKGQLDGAVERQISALSSIKGPIELSDGSFLSVTDQLRNVRSELWSLKHVEPGAVGSNKTEQARVLHDAVDAVLKNPENADPAFRAAWATANVSHSRRINTLQQAPIVAAARSESPEQLVRMFLKPDNSSDILAIRGTLPQAQWDKFQSAAYSDLMSEPGTIVSKLDGLGKETRDALMSRSDQEAFYRFGKELDRVAKVGASEIKERQVKNMQFIDKMIRSADPRDSVTLIRALKGSKNAARRESARAAIVDWAWDGVVEPVKGGVKINNATLKSRVAQLKDSGVWNLLSKEERQIIGNAEIVSRAFSRVADAGTSIIGATAVQGVKGLEASAFATFFQNGLFSVFVRSQVGKHILIGSGKYSSNGALLRALGGATAQMSATVDLEQPEDED